MDVGGTRRVQRHHHAVARVHDGDEDGEDEGKGEKIVEVGQRTAADRSERNDLLHA